MADKTAAGDLETSSTFAGVLGNRPALLMLERALSTGEVAHAYLLFGPPGVGKRTVALRFAAALVAGGDEAAADRAIRGLHPDLIEVEPEGAFTTIGQVREVLRLAASRPFEGLRRVFLLRADTLNVQAANALLKTLEEPEGEVVFVLMAASRDGALPTIVSRSRPVRFDPVPPSEVRRFLERRRAGEIRAGSGSPEAGGPSALEPAVAAALGRGSVGLSLRYAEERELGELREAVLAAAFALSGDYGERSEAARAIFGRAESVGAAREKASLEAVEEPDRRTREAAKRAGKAARDAAVREALGLLALVYRDAAVVAAGAPELVASIDRVAEIQHHVEAHPGADWAAAAMELGEARAALTYNVSPEAILEVSLSRTRRRILGPSPGS